MENIIFCAFSKPDHPLQKLDFLDDQIRIGFLRLDYLVTHLVSLRPD